VPSAKATRRRITVEKWHEIVQGFRDHPGEPRAVARVADVDWRTAQKAWEVGLPYPFAVTPIRELLEAEQVQARAEALRRARAEGVPPPPPPAAPLEPGVLPPAPPRAELPAEQRQNARDHAAQARAAEAELVRFARGNVVVLCGANAQLVRLGLQVVQRAKTQWERLLSEAEAADMKRAEKVEAGEPILPSDFADIDHKDAERFLRMVAGFTSNVVRAGDTVVEMQRKLLGGDDSLPDDASMTEEEAVAIIGEAEGSLRRYQAGRARLQVIQGGASTTPPGVGGAQNFGRPGPDGTGTGPSDRSSRSGSRDIARAAPTPPPPAPPDEEEDDDDA
jgi:hypothetical protein